MSNNNIRLIFLRNFKTNEETHTKVPRDLQNIVRGCSNVSKVLNSKMHNNDMNTINKGKYALHCLKYKKIIIIAVCEMCIKLRVAISLLEKISEELSSQSQFSTSKAKKIIKYEMKYFNDPKNDGISKCKRKIFDVGTLMIDQIDKVLEQNLKRTEDVDRDATKLKHDAIHFRKQNRELQIGAFYKCLGIPACCPCFF